jgi:general secretion pathway protein C
MDLAKVLAAWRNQPPEQWLALANRVVPPVAVVALVIFLAFQAAGLTWRLLEQPPRPEDVPPAASVAMAGMPRSGGGTGLATLSGWEPFGKAPAGGAATMLLDDFNSVPETELDLRLHGVKEVQDLPESGSDVVVIPEAGAAVISVSGGAQSTYHTGDPIGNTNVRLHSVYADRVMLDPGNGNLEKLSFPDAAQLAQQSGRTTATINRSTQPFRAPQTIGTPAAAVEAATGAAALFSQHIVIAQHLEGDQAVGFRLQPRNNSTVMSRLGFEPGDVLTEVNGRRLNDLRNVNTVLQTLQQTQQANVKVLRNGVEQPLVIDMGQIARLAESLQ